MRLTRRRFLLSLAGLGASGAGGYLAWRHETEGVVVEKPTVSIPGLSGTLRIVQLSDWHASNVVRGDYLRRAIAKATLLKPDLFCLTGDYTTDGAPYLPLVQDLVSQLTSVAPTFACIGNHDGTYVTPRDVLRAATVKALEDGGATFLYNRSIVLNTPAGRIRLAGVGDLWSGFFDPASTLPEGLERLPTVLLSHNPDSVTRFEGRSWDLMLCGHTHGGQINLPFAYGALAPIQRKRFLEGLVSTSEGRQVYINRGLGSLGGIRFRARPEITLLTLQPAEIAN